MQTRRPLCNLSGGPNVSLQLLSITDNAIYLLSRIANRNKIYYVCLPKFNDAITTIKIILSLYTIDGESEIFCGPVKLAKVVFFVLQFHVAVCLKHILKK